MSPKHPVNSVVTRQVNRVISPQGLEVLRALAAAKQHRRAHATHYDTRINPPGTLDTKALIHRLSQHGSDQAVVKASLSRTLRRLWRVGLVELLDDRDTTMTEAAARVRPSFERRQANPRAAYKEHKKFCANYGIDGYRSLEAFIAARCSEATFKADYRATRVAITASGRTAVNSVRRATVNRTQDRPSTTGVNR